MPQVKWIETNEMYWEDRYVKGCCWQLLLLPRWLVPNDRPVEKGAFDNTASTIHQILVPFSLFIFHFCIVVGTDLESKHLGLFYKLACEMHFVSFRGLWVVALKIAYHQLLAHSSNTVRHAQIHKSHFLSPPSSALPPSHMPQINIQAGVGGGAFAAR